MLQARKTASSLLVLLLVAACLWREVEWRGVSPALRVATPSSEELGLLDPGFDRDSSAAVARVRRHEWIIGREMLAPDGVVRPMLTVNGRFPGPTIEAHAGDTIIVTVHNRIELNLSTLPPPIYSSIVDDVVPLEAEHLVAIHWHGLEMRGAPQADGAPGFTSYAIGPGQSHEYRFKVTEADAGTHWWHSHVGVSRADGLWGALVVHSGRSVAALRSRGLDYTHQAMIAVGDHYHKPAREQLGWFLSRRSLGLEPVPDGGLINGRNVYDCAHDRLTGAECHAEGTPRGGSYSSLQLRTGETARLRIVNVGSLADMFFSIDGHSMTVIEADGTLVEPVDVERLPIAPGQRYSVLIKRREPGTFWMRSDMDADCLGMPNPALNLTATLAVLRWGRASRVERRGSGEARPSLVRRFAHGRELDPNSLVPLNYADPAPPLHLSAGDRRVIVSAAIPKLEKYELSPIGVFNRTSWRSEAVPVLERVGSLSPKQLDDALSGESPLTDERKQIVILPPTSNDAHTVELVVNNLDEASHPFHLHGHSFWVMEVGHGSGGWGTWADDGQSQRYNLTTAMRRDTVSVPKRGYAVLRWRADNPGVWAFHCHVLVHMASGMAMAFVDMPGGIESGTARITAS